MSDYKNPVKSAAVIMVAAWALICSGAGAAQAESVLTVAMTAADIPDWAGQPDQGFEGYRFVGYSLYDGLINWNLSSSSKEVTIKPGLATEWHVDPHDAKRWIFTLRHGVKFHDSCSWNADAAVWNLERLIDRNNPSFSPVYFARARARTSDIAKVEKVSDDTIAITTTTVNSLFPYNLPYVMMVSKCAVEAAGNNYTVYARHPAGSGPYKFARVVPHQSLELVKNPDYWDPTRVPKHDRLVLLPMPEGTTRAAALLSGQVNFIEAPSPDMIPELKQAGMHVITNVYPHTWPYLLNMLRGPFADIRVRQAANYAVDRNAMVTLLGGIATPSYGALVPSQHNYGDVVQYKLDQARATALLKAAGCYPCEIHVAISPAGSGQMQPEPMNELVKSQLDAVGFKVDFDTIDWNSMIDVFVKGAVAYPRYDAFNFSSGALDPLSLLKAVMKVYQAPNGSNWGGLNDPQLDALGQRVLTTFDPAQQDALLKQIHHLITADAARLFIVSDLNPRALAPNLSGFVEAQSWFQDLTPIVVH
jgi:peptide/nickel transport system substrate-binding protein